MCSAITLDSDREGRRDMKALQLVPATLAMALLAATAPVAAANEKGEAKLARLIDGRVAGEPVRCLDSSKRRNLEIVDHTALVFKDGDTLYVSRPAGVDFLSWSDIPVFEIWGGQLCKMDIVHLRDRSTGMGGPSLSMAEFIPYKRAG
jgi:hypothetical protein